MTGIEWLIRAEKAYEEKRFASAIQDAHSALEAGLDVDNPPSERGEYIPARETSSCHILIGSAHLELGDTVRALEHLDRAIAVDRTNYRAWGNRGHARRELGDVEAALSDLTRSLEEHRDYAFARFRRAQSYADLGKWVESERDLDELLSRNPQDAAPLELWREVRRQQSKPDTR